MLIIAPRPLFWQAYYKYGLPDRHSPLTFAVADRDCVMVEQLVHDGHDVNARNRCGGYPILYAVKQDDPEMVHLLRSLGASVSGERNPLWSAISGQMVDLLIELGANPNELDEEGCTPLYYGEKGNPDVVTAFLRNGADINAKSAYGHTAIWEVIANYGDPNEVACLLDQGAEIPYPPDGCAALIEWLQGTDPWRGDLIAYVREYQRTNGEVPPTFREWLSSFEDLSPLHG